MRNATTYNQRIYERSFRSKHLRHSPIRILSWEFRKSLEHQQICMRAYRNNHRNLSKPTLLFSHWVRIDQLGCFLLMWFCSVIITALDWFQYWPLVINSPSVVVDMQPWKSVLTQWPSSVPSVGYFGSRLTDWTSLGGIKSYLRRKSPSPLLLLFGSKS